ncbi:hypothetical protein [Stutzerimonas nitrititolerans]|uniref:Uncharacterized protein n=1 Tax=Stutzerimonas nitrititolerans TaxID=2482751 RepID=A0ABX9V7N2_9GAMM|nr:hypothetical protein [Stutzerimonas nitrititolerans]KRW69156.1 hypothetical protein AO729_04965 [Pseudomonas sp. TTU2014-066ASC]RMI00916.1 hypothetical protein EA795_10845 [Stutzerimonas nitrititolerans]
MFSRILKVGLLAGCLVAAGTASAADRNVVVPVLAGAAVGAVLVAVLADSSDDRHRHHTVRHHHRPAPPRYHLHHPRHAPRGVKHGYPRKHYVVVERHGYRGGRY